MPFLIDTCVWIDVELGRIGPADVAKMTRGDLVFLSPITLAELRYGADSAADADTRQRRWATLDRMRNKPLLPIRGSTGSIFGSLAAQLRAAGKQPRHRVQDLWQASLGVEYACPIVTRNGQDFADIPGLDVLAYQL